MKLLQLKLRNFRSYQNEVIISFDNLTSIIGTNDVGKSTILEALEIFFNNQLIKIEQNDACVFSVDKNVYISCVFTDLPETLILDSSAQTSLEDEYLLNSYRYLEICKVYDCSKKNPKPKIYAVANHPSNEPFNNLLELQNAKLKTLLKELNVPEDGIDLRSNVELRKAIWNYADLEFDETYIEFGKEDAKSIWEQIEKYFPMYALFQSDRSSSDSDVEVQDPLKIAVRQAIEQVEDDLERIKELVQNEVLNVATNTLSKLREMDENLANQLTPTFKEEPKWSGLFKLSLEGDNNIPINKRGSGVRRLILLNFFRAEAERRKTESMSKNIIYAIEEPETSQHPNNQMMLAQAFIDLVEADSSQVILTTHVPGFAEFMPKDSLRFIEEVNGIKVINEPNDDTISKIANALGVFPTPINKESNKVLVCVEGINDVAAIKFLSSIISSENPELIDINKDDRVIVIPLGGSTLKAWVQNQYLKELGFPEVHIYDRDDQYHPKYEHFCNQVNTRKDGSKAFLTDKKEMENYIHPDVINTVFGVNIYHDDWLDVPKELAKKVHENNNSSKPWKDVKEEKRKEKERKVKLRLNSEAIQKMTYEQLCEIDTNREIITWLDAIMSILENDLERSKPI